MFEPIAYGEYEGELYLIEPSGQREIMDIIRNSDGKCYQIKGPQMITETRRGVKEYGMDKTIQCFARIGKQESTIWRPMYKPGAVARLIEHELRERANQ